MYIGGQANHIMEEDQGINDALQQAMLRFKLIAKKKKDIEENKLCKRQDVQVLRKKIAILNQELIHSKREMEQTKAAYEQALTLFNNQTKQHKQLVEHLSIISQTHNERQQKQIQELSSMMKCQAQPAGIVPVSRGGSKSDRTEERNADYRGRSQTASNKGRTLPSAASEE